MWPVYLRVLIRPFSFSQAKLPPGANRILFVKNLNYQITGEDLYDLFGRYGSIRQIRIGNEAKTKGTAFVVFDDVMDVRAMCYAGHPFCPSPTL
jgi:RNA recognition motif-containing protein